MCMEKTDWERAVEFHGHVCPGLAIGFRAAQLALERLGAGRAADEEMVAIVENDACGVDAVQVLTGCTFGKGNLIFRDFGKHVYTFIHRTTQRAVRVAVPTGAFHRPDTGDRTAEWRERQVQSILASGEDAFDIREVVCTPPPRAKRLPSVTCYRCGESVMETRARVRDGKTVCIPCREAD
jgi:formylmethanofuran dehydrogenase subunit E